VHGNVASQIVFESLGYVVTGNNDVEIRGRLVRQSHRTLEPCEWETRRRDDVRIEGLVECRGLFEIF
jgi:hypothetical protein